MQTLEKINFLTDVSKKTLLYVIISVLIVCILITTLTIVFILKRKKSHKENEAVNDIVSKIISFLGNKENILHFKNRRSRLEFEVKNIINIKKEEINQLKLGATLTANIIKFSLKENINEVVKKIKKRLKGE